MTPEMSPTDLALARRSETTAGMLSRYWTWGRRDQIADVDPIELEYQHCYPETAIGRCDDPANAGMPPRGFYTGIAKEMIARRRERMVLDALGDLSIYLEGLRDERKAVIAISDGWLLYRPNPTLTRLAPCDQPSTGPQATPGLDGRITTAESTHHRCEADRGKLAQLDDWQRFQDLLDRANRANVSFYPIDSRGLPAFDTQIYEDTPTTIGVPVYVDKQMLTTRIENLRTLADATDGLAVVENNNLERGVRRIVDDLTSYYLLGYYSTNPKLDGRFRSIKVRVKRPGVDVRARRGYKAPTEEEVTRGHELTAKAAVSGPPPAFQAAIASLAAVRSNFRFITSVSWLAAPIDDSVPGAKSHVWIVGEMDQATSKGQEWLAGAEADVLLTAADGVKIAELSQPVPAPVRIVNVTLPDVPLGPGEYTLRLRLKPSGGGLPFMDTVHFTVADAGDLTGKARLLRRGLSTGVQYVATADPQFRRTDRLRVEVPLLGAVDGARGELLNRTGQVMPVPVETSTHREDATLQWARADASLAPLAPGDYAIRTTILRGTAKHEVLTAFRVVP
jgi:VWFA-related protein